MKIVLNSKLNLAFANLRKEKETDPNDETEHKKLLECGPPADAIPANPGKNECMVVLDHCIDVSQRFPLWAFKGSKTR